MITSYEMFIFMLIWGILVIGNIPILFVIKREANKERGM